MSPAPGSAPIKTGGNGRDPQTGRFLAGNPGGPGRPRRPDLFGVVQERAAAEGLDVDAELYGVVLALLKAAQGGDVAAAKLLLDKLTTQDAQVLEVVTTGPPEPESLADFADFTLQLAKLHAEFRAEGQVEPAQEPEGPTPRAAQLRTKAKEAAAKPATLRGDVPPTEPRAMTATEPQALTAAPGVTLGQTKPVLLGRRRR